jgi:protein TonB
MNPQAVAVSYGALELKRAYQHNLLLGLLFAVALHLAAVTTIAILRPPDPVPLPAPAPTETGPIDVRKFRVPVLPTEPPSPAKAIEKIKPPAFGIPTAAADETVPDDVQIPTKLEAAKFAQSDFAGAELGEAGLIDTAAIRSADDYFPEPGEFVATEEMPVCIHAETPLYPELARLTHREGSVKVSALVDLDGTVLKVLLAKSSGANAGFDEAALAAVAKNRYRPAIQNGRPVRVWVTHTVEFRLN